METKHTNTQVNRCKISWEDYQNDVKLLAELILQQELRNRERYSGIYGIPRGGLVVAVSLSHLLGLPLLKKPNSTCIVCDDLVDSGETMRKVVGNKIRTVAVLYRKDSTTFEPHFSVRTINSWIVLPFETSESSKYDGTNIL